MAFSPYRESVGSQEESGTLFADVGSQDALAPYIRIAVGQGWMSGYSDGTFRPDQAVTLEEGCSAVLNLLGDAVRDRLDPQNPAYETGDIPKR